MCKHLFSLLFFLLFCSAVFGQKDCLPQTVYKGEGTYYGATGGGNCSFDVGTNNLKVGAMNNSQYANSQPCGACVEVKGPKGSLQIMVVDRCPECKQGDLDLSESAFEQIAEKSAGRVPIEWHYIPCPVSNNVRYKYKEGSSQWWIGIQVRNHRYAIAKLEYKNTQGNFTEIPRLDYNYFVANGGIDEDKNKTGPYHLRITDVHGQTIEDTNVRFDAQGEVTGSVQFPECKPTSRPEIQLPSFIVFPNPVTDDMTITFEDEKPHSLTLTDLQGRVLAKCEAVLSSERYSLAFLPAGLYFLRTEHQTIKLIKSN